MQTTTRTPRGAIRPEDSQLQRRMDFPEQAAAIEELLKTDTPDSQVNRQKLCEIHSHWILEDPESAAAADCVARMWKRCCYESIARTRKRIMKEKKKGIDSTEAKASLNSLLRERVELMEYLIDRLKDRILKENVNEGTTDRHGIVQCLSRLYICLGDLYRYDEKNDKATSAYNLASSLAPGSAHSFNQLAVISDCKESTAVATYWYLRAIHHIGDRPGSLAEGNIRFLLTKNRNWLKTQDTEATPVLASSATKLFVSKFVDLFYAGFLQEDIHPNVVLNCINSFQTLLQSSAFSDSLLCKLITILAAKDTYIYDFGLCLVERVLVMLHRKATRRTLVPALLLIEYVLIKPDVSKKDFWENVVSIWNDVALQEIESEDDSFLKEYASLKGYRPFEPFIGTPTGYYLSNAEACALFGKQQTETESASARIVRFRKLKPALLKLECIVEGPGGTLLFQDPNASIYGGNALVADDSLGVVDDDVGFANDDKEYDEGEDIVLSVPVRVQPASKRQAVSNSPVRPAAAAPGIPKGVVAPMTHVPDTATFPLLSGHVAPFQDQQEATTPLFGQLFNQATAAAIGPPPGFGQTPLFGNTSTTPAQPSLNQPFQLNTTTANPFAWGDTAAATPSVPNAQQEVASVQPKQANRVTTKNPFVF